MPRGRKPKEKKYELSLPENTRNDIIATSKSFLKGELDSSDVLGWTHMQQKLFILMLCQIDWRDLDRPSLCNQDKIVAIDNETAMKMMGWSGKLSNFTKVMQDEFHQMMTHSCICVQDPYTGKWFNDNFITRSWGDKRTTYVQLASPILAHFERLYDLPKKGRFCNSFASISKQGLLDSETKATYPLILELHNHINRKALISSCVLSVTQIRILCSLPENAYMKDINKETGEYRRFDRTNFEKKIIDKFVEDILNCEDIKIFQLSDGLYYKRHYSRGRVVAYEFFYRILEENEIALNRNNAILSIAENRYFNPNDATEKEQNYLKKMLLSKEGKLTQNMDVNELASIMSTENKKKNYC